MANEEHLKILKQGVKAWNEWREKNPPITPGLAGANFYKADLTRANLYEADLSEADLSKANLTRANLYKADLSVADLTRANLSAAKLIKADLSKANLNKADLTRANLYEADLTGAQDLTAKQLITTINWQEAILDSSLRVEAEKLIGAENR